MSSDRLTQQQLETLILDSRWEKSWRDEADRAADYYDNKQLTPQLISTYKARGLAPLVRNLIAPTINLMLGIEAKTRRDWKVAADDDDAVDLALAMSQRLKDATRLANANKACSDAYADQVKTGVGWVEVGRNSNPFLPFYRVARVHRREIVWDHRAVESDLSDARYLVRRRFVDLDIALLKFPSKAALLKNAMARWASFDVLSESGSLSLDLADAYENEHRTKLEDGEWRDMDRRRICLYEVWYRNWENRPVLIMPGGGAIEFDQTNDYHVAAVAQGLARVERASFPKVRLAWFGGPHYLNDVPSPYSHGHFPYVLFPGYQEDNTGIYYGAIRNMMSPQDEINTRLMKMMWLLSAKRITMDSDALDMPVSEAAEEVARPDSVVLLNPNRTNKTGDAFRVENDFALSEQQFKVLQDATHAIQETAGVYQAMLGNAQFAGQSGLAINSLVEQGATTLAELNDNYRYSRRRVGMLLLELVREDIGAAPYRVVVDDDGRKKEILLNQPTQNALGETYLTNDVVRTQMRVEIEDVQDTPTYRQQQLMNLTELAKSMPPELQPYLALYFVKASDLPFRNELAAQLAQRLGVNAPNGAPDEAQAAQAAQEAQAAQAQRQMQMEQMQAQMQLLSAKIDAEAAKADKARADADFARARASQIGTDQVGREQQIAHAEDTHALDMDQRALALAQSLEKPEPTPAQV